MIEGLKPYEKYRAVDLPWLDSLPDKWQVRRGRGVFECVDVRSKTGSEELLSVSAKDGVRPRSEKAVTMFQANSYVGHKLAWPGDLVINSLWAWMKGLGFSKYHGIVSTAYGVYRPRPEHCEGWRYFNYLFRSNAYDWELQVRSKGIWISRMQLTDWSFLDMPVVIPPIDEQAAIVKFLDHANWKIDKFIRAKRKLIALLGEQKQAIIHRAVTRGLDRNVSLKPSGIPWLGDIPAHWDVRRLRTIVRRIEQGVSPQATGFLAEGDSWGVLKSGCVNHGVFRQTEHKQLAKDFPIDPGIVVKVGDVLISRACGSPKLVGSVGKVEVLDYKLILSDKTFRAVFTEKVDTDFIVYSMNSIYYRQQVEQAISGAEGMANNLPLSELRSFVFLLPPLLEAKQIASQLNNDLSQFTSAIARTEREIALMQEYRTRLTADIVTGKLDVREAAVHLPDLSIETNSSPDPAELEEESELEEIES